MQFFEFFTFYIISLLLFLIFIFCLKKLLSKLFSKNKKFDELINKIPGPSKSYPLIGNLNMLWFSNFSKLINPLDQLYSGLAKIYAEHGICKLKFGPIQSVLVFRKDLVEDFLKNNSNIEKPFEYQLLYDWLRKGLLINDNTLLWKQRRKLLTPTFHFKVIEDFIPAINEKSNILVENLTKLVEKQSFDMTPLLFTCALDIICETTLGIHLNSQQNKNIHYFKAVHRMSDNFFERLLKPWLWPDIIFYSTKIGKQVKEDLKILHGLSRGVINERKISLLENRKQNKLENADKKRKRLAFLDLLLDLHLNDNSLSLEDIQEEVDTFMFAGHDTTACCLSWTFYLIGSNLDIQHRIQQELDSIVTKNEDINIDHIKQMTYLEAVIKESMRVFPPVPIIVRKITEDLKLGDYEIPKGVSLYLLINSLHLDPNVFPDPLAFKPERFLAENQIGESPFSFTPFSAGSRNCIGQKLAMNEIKLVLSKVLLNFELKSLDNRSDIIVLNSIVSKPRNGIRMQITPRKLL